jgi:hypothetical protein
MATIPAPGSFWRKKPPGCEVVQVRRVWYGLRSLARGDHWVVRAHPVHGGRVLVADAHWFTTEGYEPVEAGE